MNSAISLYAWSGSTVLKIVGLNLPTSSSWQQSGWIYLTVPAGTTHLTVYGRIFNQASGWVVFDDFELVEA